MLSVQIEETYLSSVSFDDTLLIRAMTLTKFWNQLMLPYFRKMKQDRD